MGGLFAEHVGWAVARAGGAKSIINFGGVRRGQRTNKGHGTGGNPEREGGLRANKGETEEPSHSDEGTSSWFYTRPGNFTGIMITYFH